MNPKDIFKNEPFTDFANEKNAADMMAAIDQVRSELGMRIPLVVNGEKILTDRSFESVNPGEKSQVVALCSDADADAMGYAQAAIDAATSAFEGWRKVPAAERADYLFRAAAIIRDRKIGRAHV